MNNYRESLEVWNHFSIIEHYVNGSHYMCTQHASVHIRTPSQLPTQVLKFAIIIINVQRKFVQLQVALINISAVVWNFLQICSKKDVHVIIQVLLFTIKLFYLLNIFLTALRILVGNKTDLEKTILPESVENFKYAHSCTSAYTVSAKTGITYNEDNVSQNN